MGGMAKTPSKKVCDVNQVAKKIIEQTSGDTSLRPEPQGDCEKSSGCKMEKST
jgi:hypothetical protein